MDRIANHWSAIVPDGHSPLLRVFASVEGHRVGRDMACTLVSSVSQPDISGAKPFADQWLPCHHSTLLPQNSSERRQRLITADGRDGHSLDSPRVLPASRSMDSTTSHTNDSLQLQTQLCLRELPHTLRTLGWLFAVDAARHGDCIGLAARISMSLLLGLHFLPGESGTS